MMLMSLIKIVTRKTIIMYYEWVLILFPWKIRSVSHGCSKLDLRQISLHEIAMYTLKEVFL